MTQSLRAIYEKGVLRPLEPLALEENQQITITLSDQVGGWSDDGFLREIEGEADESVTLEQVRNALAKIPGTLTADFQRERDERS